MVDVFIIHGAYSHPNENWYPWMRKELENSGCQVFVPRFPDKVDFKSWMEKFRIFEKYLDENSIIIGHNVGAAFLLHLLEKTNRPIKAAYLVGGFVSSLNDADLEETNQFVEKNFIWHRIKNNCGKFYIFHSDNDPYVPLDKCEELASNLGVKGILIPDAEHFTKRTGYKKFEILLEKVRENLGKK